MCILQILFPAWLVFILSNSVFCRAEVSDFNKNPFFFMGFTCDVVSKNSMPNAKPLRFLLYFFLDVFSFTFNM